MKMNKCIICLIFLFGLQTIVSCQEESAPVVAEIEQPEKLPESFKIIAKSNPRVTTDTLTSGDLTIGINRNGGGAINQVIIPGIGDIMQEQADKYGRCGQSSIRDRGHGKRYNPTQAGFNETLGTKCKITQSSDKKVLTVESRPVTLWHGDGKYDFTRWENIGKDPYNNDGGNSDEDGLDEETLPGKQASEVKSEFNFYGTYENIKGKYGIKTAAIRHYFEYRFIRPPGHAIKQHRRGTKLFDPSQLVDDISVQHPSGTFKATDKDMSKLMPAWAVRYDIDTWDPGFRYIKPKGKLWELMNRNNPIRRRRNEGFKQAFIISSSQDVNKGKAIGLYKPYSDINKFRIIGVNESDGSISYKDNRTLGRGSLLLDNARRISTMSVSGFQDEQVGLINRNRLPKNIYEAVRAEVYLFYGTPKEIMDAIADLDNGLGL